MNKLHPVFGSSVDPTALALSWKGAALGVVPIVVLIAAQFGADLTPNDLSEVINAVFAVVSSGITAFGLCRKVWVKLKK